LAGRMIGSISTLGHSLDNDFENARSYYTSLSQNFALETDNVAASIQWGGLFLDCTGATETDTHSGLPRFIVTIDSDMLLGSTWWSLNNCADGVWIINIGGADDVTFQGGDFPGISERVLFNVLGSGRTISVVSGVSGNILGPNHYFSQTGGVTHGLVIVGDILASLSTTQPDCHDFQSYDIVTVNTDTINAGDSDIPVAGNTQFALGDQVDINGGSESVTVTDLTIVDGQSYITVDPAVSGSYTQGTFISTTINDPSLHNRTLSTPTVITTTSSANGASGLTVGITAIVAAFFYALF